MTLPKNLLSNARFGHQSLFTYNQTAIESADDTEDIDQLEENIKEHNFFQESSLARSGGVVQLRNGWKAYGGPYGSPRWDIRNGYCFIHGLIKSGRWGHLAYVPPPCRP